MFQRLMDSVLAGLQWSSCLVYVDDVIPGKSFKEHLSNLCNVFSCIRSANLKIHPSKCAVVRKRSIFWGISSQQREFRQTRRRRSRSLHGPLRNAREMCTEKAASFCWSEKCQQAFDEFCQRLITAPFPDPSKPFTLDTDASATGIGAVLSQVKEGQECAVA